MAFKLTIEQGRGAGQSFEFTDDEITIGRTEENDIVLFEGGVSRQHCRIEFLEGRYVLTDLESANGTQLNSRRTTSAELQDGDRIGVGAAIFRFESLAAAPAGSATRIVSLDARGNPVNAGGAPAATGGKPATTVAPTGRGLPRPVVLGGLAALLLLAGLLALALRRGGDEAHPPCSADLDLRREGFQELVFSMDEGLCDPGDLLSFSFDYTPRTRVILHFAPFYTDKGEVVVQLNGTKIAESQLAPTRKSFLQTVTLPEKLLTAGALNTLEFVTSGDEDWGIERVELEVIGLADADAAKAEEQFTLGLVRYKEKNVAARNLYDAWRHMRDARRYMEGLEPKPNNYSAALDYIRDWQKELDKVCAQKMFDANKEATYGRYAKANELYSYLLAAFPGDAHPCRARAEDSMFVIE
jgi:pSer/pThr/pTyr-binding forkhead associated (FHA) protein